MAGLQRDDMMPALKKVLEHARRTLKERSDDALPAPEAVQAAANELVPSLGDDGLPPDAVAEHLLGLTTGFSNSSLSSTYYGFVTGGSTPYATFAEIIASVYDQNVGVHLPDQSVATHVEDRAHAMFLQLIGFNPDEFPGRSLSTGATASNIQGLACGREWIIQKRLGDGPSVGELGLLEACQRAGVHEIKILSTSPHSSLGKAASIVGLGRDACMDMRRDQAEQEIRFDFKKLEAELKVEGRACIVAVSCGEVNTGNYATYSRKEMAQLRELCDKYRAWLHADGGECEYQPGSHLIYAAFVPQS
jgi:glutamate/tyrosine decarboxylase-like PLP-dependent enzyme